MTNHPKLIKILSLKRISFTICLFTFTIILLYINLEKSSNFDKKLRRVKVNLSTLYIDNILDCEEKIDRGQSIFFLDTTRMKHPNKIRELTLRQACAIESAARSNLNSKIFVIFVSPYHYLREINFTPIMQSILDYPNIYVYSMNLMQFSLETHYDDLIKNGNLLKSKFIKQHTSDLLRFLLLMRYGGTYIDTDMIVMENLKRMKNNFICRDHGYLNGAIMNLDGTNKGKNFGKLFLNDMIQNFNGSLWGWNGPYVFHRVLENLCDTSDVNKMHNCNGFHILDDNICYPVAGTEWEKLFDEEFANDVIELIKTSYAVHFWNKLSQAKKLKCNSVAAYTQLARKYCPNTFQLCTEYF